MWFRRRFNCHWKSNFTLNSYSRSTSNIRRAGMLFLLGNDVLCFHFSRSSSRLFRCTYSRYRAESDRTSHATVSGNQIDIEGVHQIDRLFIPVHHLPNQHAIRASGNIAFSGHDNQTVFA